MHGHVVGCRDGSGCEYSARNGFVVAEICVGVTIMDVGKLSCAINIALSRTLRACTGASW